MKLAGGFGVGQQGFHPRARSSLPAEGRRQRQGQFNMANPETEYYFVPSFSIRRHLHRTEENQWDGVLKQLSGMFGRHFTTVSPPDMCIKSIEQKALIHKIRESGSHPTAEEMQDVVYNIRDGLTEALSSSPDPLPVGLGRLAVFGRGRNKVGFNIDGWKGWRARYALTDEYGNMTANGALLVENQIALGSIATALSDTAIAVDEIASNPHLTLATGSDKIRPHELRKMQSAVDKLCLESVMVGDPVIDFKPSFNSPNETLHVRHSWDTLALMR